jgi:hypothetical protein
VVRYLLKLKYGIRWKELGLDDVEKMDNEIFRKIYLINNKVEAAMALQNHYLQNHEIPLPINVLYQYVPGFGWELIK